MIIKLIRILILVAPLYCSAQDTISAKKVFINYAVNQLTNIDYVNQTFEIDFYFQQYWKLDLTDLITLRQNNINLKDGSK